MGNKTNRTHPVEEEQSPPPYSFHDYNYEYDQRADYDSGWYQGKEYGKPYFEEKGKPVIQKRRSCTDVTCLFLFLAFLAGWGAVAFYGFQGGDIKRAIYPTDTEGHICGWADGPMADRPFTLMFDMTQCLNPAYLVEGCLTPQVCVEKCPEENFSPLWAARGGMAQEVIKEKIKPFCKKKEFDLKSKTLSVEDLVHQGICPLWYLKSSPILGRCIPGEIKQEKNDTIKQVLVKRIFDSSQNTSLKSDLEEVPKEDLQKGMRRFAGLLAVRQFGERIFNDLVATWWMICMALLGASVLSFVWILLMRFLTGPLVYISILTVFVGVGGGFAFCGWTLYNVWGSTDVETHQHIFQLNWTPDIAEDFLKQKDTWIAFTSVIGILFLVIVCLFIFLWQRIRIAIALIEQGSKAVSHMCSSLFFPVIPFLFQLLVVAWFLFVALFLATWGSAENRLAFKDPHLHTVNKTPACLQDPACLFLNATINKNQSYKAGDLCEPPTVPPTPASNSWMEGVQECQKNCKDVECQFVKYTNNKDFSWMQWVNVFGLYWGLFFFSAFGELVLAGVFSEWYWTMKKKDVPSCALGSALWNATVFHLGTVAFGSLIIAIIRLVRTILEYIERKCKMFNNDLVKCILCCCKCCLYCLEKFMRFINRNAYIMCAIKSKNFCRSAKDAFNLLMRNLVRVVVLDCVVDFLLFLGKLVIVLLTGAGAYFFFSGWIPEIKEEIPSLNYIYTPIFFIAVGSYFIASAFFGVYAMAVDTLFLCLLEDLERNDGTLERPYYMSKSLLGILGKMQHVAQSSPKKIRHSGPNSKGFYRI